MGLSAKLDPIGFNRDLSATLAEVTSKQARSRILIETFEADLATADAINRAALGREAKRDITVDGRLGGAIASVRPDGTLIAEYRLITDALWAIWEMLVLNSPHGDATDTRPGHPGMYNASHVLLADDVPIAIHRGMEIPESASTFAFVNIQPYARKIERGSSSQSPGGVYQVVAALARSRFGNVAKITFGYRSITIGAVSAWSRRASARRLAQKRGGNPALHDDWLTRQPAVIIEPR